MAELNDYDFSKADAGASLEYNIEAGQLRVGGFMCIKGRPSKISNVSTSKTGKHGHAKCNFTAIDIFNGKKYEDIIPSSHNTTAPNVKRNEYTLMDISEDGFCSLMDDEGNVREDVKLPEWPDNFAREIKTKYEEGSKTLLVTVLSAMAHDQIVSLKEDST